MAQKALPLYQLQAFEAAARQLSFSRAAPELNVLGPAVGRQVAFLEADLGTPLFIRTKPRLTLTEAGTQLFMAVAEGFDEIRASLDMLRVQRETLGIVVNVAIGFTSFYLLPRMAEFQSLHPDIQVQVVTRDQNPDFDPTTCDVVVSFGDGGLPGTRFQKIMPEVLVAVCSPGYLGSCENLSQAELINKRLLHMSSASHIDDWDRYFDGTSIAVTKPPQTDRFHSYMVYMRAIQNGMGIGLSWRPLIDDFLEAGSLVLACAHECKTTRGYYCSLTERGAEKAGTVQFFEWLSGSASIISPSQNVKVKTNER